MKPATRPSTRRRIGAAMLAVAAMAGLGSCDWIHYGFMNSIPFRGDPSRNPDVYVYLGVDGLSYHTVKDAMAQGAFAGPEWKLAKFITMFPGTSDISWTRILHTRPLGGYEIEYYDPTTDSVANSGVSGLAKHVMPAISEGLSFEFDYLKAFDYRANGYMHSLQAYRDTFVSLGDTLDNLFFLLGGRVETSKVFSAYLLELDVLGHMQSPQDVGRAFKMLSDRIQKFRERHPERRIHFTLMSDHGMDFIRVASDRFVQVDRELERAGITPVKSLLDHDRSRGLYAIPIMHTRVTYTALHTYPEQAAAVAGRASGVPSVDMAVSKIETPPDAPGAQWYGLWAEGRLAARFGFAPSTDTYYLSPDDEWRRFDLSMDDARGPFAAFTDEDLFARTKHAKYPDLFYRARTALSAVGLKYPADVILSFRPTYASLGFTLPGSDDIASAGFHGAMEELGTLGTLLTNERDLPDAVRADNFLDLFPRMREHIGSLKVETIEGDPNAALAY